MDSRTRKALHELTQAEVAVEHAEEQLQRLQRQQRQIQAEIIRIQSNLPRLRSAFDDALRYMDEVLDES